MALASYVSGVLECKTPLDIEECTNIHLTVEQLMSGVQIDLTEYERGEEFGVIIFKLTGEQTRKLKAGTVTVQMCGFVMGEEFYTPQYTVCVDKISLRKVLENNEL